MNPRLVRAGLAVGIIALVATTPRAQVTTAEALFREALAKERAEGALKDAVFGYERIIAEYAADRQAAGKAMYQLALIYEKQNDPRANVLLTRLVRDYSTVEPVASRAKAKLRVRQTEPPPPFPPVELDKDYELGSPDGRFVVYHKSAADWGRLHLKELATGKERLLIDDSGASVSNLAWSPDSQRLAYNFISADNKVSDIRIARIDNGESRSLGVRGYPTAWTNADEILCYRPNFKAGGTDWVLAPAGGGPPRTIVTVTFAEGDSAVGMTPDGTRLILSRSKKLFVQEVATGQAKALTNGTGEESRAQLSPDGRLVAFQGNPDGRWGIYVAPLDGGLPVANPVRLCGLDEPSDRWAGWAGSTWWTSNGLLTYQTQYSRSNLYRVEMDPKTGRPVDRPLRLTQDAAENLMPAVSPDNRRVAYWAQNGSKGGLAVMNADGTNERPLVEQVLVLDASWRTPSEILYRRAKPGETGALPIVSLNLETGGEQVVAQPEGVYWWYSPDRREILHLYPRAGGPQAGVPLKAWSLADGKDRVVAQIDYLDAQLALTPDGRRIAYMTYRPVEGATQPLATLGILSIDGVSETELIPAQTGYVAPMAWSPDGRYLLYTSETGGALIMDVASRQSWPLCRDPGDAEFCKAVDASGSWSPDGTFVVVGHREPRRRERLAWEGVTADAVARLMRRR